MTARTPSSSFWSVFVAGILLLMVFGIATILLAIWNGPRPAEDAARVEERLRVHAELMASNAERLGTYAWVDKAKGSVQIPIAHAMEITIDRLSAQSPTAAGPIVSPTPAAPEAPAEEPAPLPAEQPAPSTP